MTHYETLTSVVQDYNLPRNVFVAYPGSGNSWIRYLSTTQYSWIRYINYTVLLVKVSVLLLDKVYLDFF